MEAAEIQVAGAAQADVAIRCKVCDRGELKPTRVAGSIIARLLGAALTIVGAVLALGTLARFMPSVEKPDPSQMQPSSVFVDVLVGALLAAGGMRLLRSRKVLRCTHCTAIIDRA
ncbi:MAG TPA: hypothetical protein VEI02_13215 [Planctomycetota bacterium]|nr:hypothetical protein [Planctomycetota bacterium]